MWGGRRRFRGIWAGWCREGGGSSCHEVGAGAGRMLGGGACAALVPCCSFFAQDIACPTPQSRRLPGRRKYRRNCGTRAAQAPPPSIHPTPAPTSDMASLSPHLIGVLVPPAPRSPTLSLFPFPQQSHIILSSSDRAGMC